MSLHYVTKAADWREIVEESPCPVLLVMPSHPLSDVPHNLELDRVEKCYGDALRIVVCPKGCFGMAHGLPATEGDGTGDRLVAVLNRDKPIGSEATPMRTVASHRMRDENFLSGSVGLLTWALGAYWDAVVERTEGVRILRMGTITSKTQDPAIYGSRGEGFDVLLRANPDETCGYHLEVFESFDAHEAKQPDASRGRSVTILTSSQPYALSMSAVLDHLRSEHAPALRALKSADSQTLTDAALSQLQDDRLGSLQSLVESSAPGAWGRRVAYADGIDWGDMHEYAERLMHEHATASAVAEDIHNRHFTDLGLVAYGGAGAIESRFREALASVRQNAAPSEGMIDAEMAVQAACAPHVFSDEAIDAAEAAALLSIGMSTAALADHIAGAVLESPAAKRVVRLCGTTKEAAEFSGTVRFLSDVAAVCVATQRPLGDGVPSEAWDRLLVANACGLAPDDLAPLGTDDIARYGAVHPDSTLSPAEAHEQLLSDVVDDLNFNETQEQSP